MLFFVNSKWIKSYKITIQFIHIKNIGKSHRFKKILQQKNKMKYRKINLYNFVKYILRIVYTVFNQT